MTAHIINSATAKALDAKHLFFELCLSCCIANLVFDIALLRERNEIVRFGLVHFTMINVFNPNHQFSV